MINVTVTGQKVVERKLRSLSKEFQGRKLMRVLTKGGKVLERNAKAEAPVDTGRLRGSIMTREENGVITVGPDLKIAPHHIFIVRGTSKWPNPPKSMYWRTSIEKSIKPMTDTVRNGLLDISDKWKRRNGIRN